MRAVAVDTQHRARLLPFRRRTVRRHDEVTDPAHRRRRRVPCVEGEVDGSGVDAVRALACEHDAGRGCRSVDLHHLGGGVFGPGRVGHRQGQGERARSGPGVRDARPGRVGPVAEVPGMHKVRTCVLLVVGEAVEQSRLALCDHVRTVGPSDRLAVRRPGSGTGDPDGGQGEDEEKDEDPAGSCRDGHVEVAHTRFTIPDPTPTSFAVARRTSTRSTGGRENGPRI